MFQSGGILRNYFYSINYDLSILLLNNTGVGRWTRDYAKAFSEITRKLQIDMRLGLFYLKA